MSLAIISDDQSSNIYLPRDVWLLICGKLGARDVISLSQVSKRLYTFANDNELWKNLYIHRFGENNFSQWEKSDDCNYKNYHNKIKFRMTVNFAKDLKLKREQVNPNIQKPPVLEVISNSITGTFKVCALEAVSLLFLGVAEYKRQTNQRAESVIVLAAAVALPIIAYKHMDVHSRDNAFVFGTTITVAASIVASVPAYILYKIIAAIVNTILGK